MSQPSDELIPIKQARRKFGAPSRRTLQRYYEEGVVSKKNGKRCYLHLEQRGNYFVISEAIWERFLDELNGRVQ